MDIKRIETLKSGVLSDSKLILEEFIRLNNGSFQFSDLNHNNKRFQLWSAIFELLDNQSTSEIHILCLSSIRILSRDKTQLDEIICEKWINILLELSELYQLTVVDSEELNKQHDDIIIVESLKCLCNLVFNSKAVQTMCLKNCLAEGILCRLRTYRERNVPHDIKYFDIKLLFAVTALLEEMRDKVKNDFHGFTYLIEGLDDILRDVTPLTPGFQNVHSIDYPFYINDSQLDLCCEILKILFNLVLNFKNTSNLNERDESCMLRLMTICHSLILCKTSSTTKQNELHNNIVNFLTGAPDSCFGELIPSVTNFKSHTNEFEYEGRNMKAIHILIDFLQYKISSTQGISNEYENLSPILTVLHKGATGSRQIRKYLRLIILPPLKDVHTRPEEGNTLRNRLCRLLLTPITQVRDLVAEFLLILCKGNIGRMIKYTGYGNAAGHFANKGLLGPGRQTGDASEYSSDSEDSDTEEYLAVRDSVNPVTGCYEPPRVDPMADCTEEQKEYEAMKLVNLIDQLNKAGIIQPCRVGPDGRPEPVEHVLQLQEELPNQQIQNKKS